MATFDFELHEHACITILITGEIIAGDAKRFEQFVDALCEKYQMPEMPLAITVALNSPGGEYTEGLLLGDLFWRNGYATLVRAGEECYSAAALAFLGGAYLGAVGGWGPDRTVELGGAVGFHGFYSESLESMSLRDGMEQGKLLAILVMNYATALRVDMNFVSEGLEQGPAELLLLRTVDHFRRLGIKLAGSTRTSVLTDEGAVNVANYATGWKRPVSLWPRAGETLALVRHLTTREFRRIALNRLLARQTERGPFMDLIRQAAADRDDGHVALIYRELERLDAVPRLWLQDNDRIVQVSGFDFGGGFYATDCFIGPSNENTPDLAVTVFIYHTSDDFREVSYSHSGDCLYEIHRPDEVL
jgi:hypothetical protein